MLFKIKFELIMVIPCLLFVCSQFSEGRMRNSNESNTNGNNRNPNNKNRFDNMNLSLWIDKEQAMVLSGMPLDIYGIYNGSVVSELKNQKLNQYLPTIPTEVDSVIFSWKSGRMRFNYTFYHLESSNHEILEPPTISIPPTGRIPRREKTFRLNFPCTGRSYGLAMFSIGLRIVNGRGMQLHDTPLFLNFKKECTPRGVYDDDTSASITLTPTQGGPDSDCSKKCNGFCDESESCRCEIGYMGQYCQKAFCYPQCMNGGNCTAPGKCSCPTGYQGPSCEGGICTEKCLNGGKCIQKDKCQCTKGYYGNRCEFSKCTIPCQNETRCVGNNKCKCPKGLSGNHCEIGRRQRSTCKRACGKHGVCLLNKCECKEGFFGLKCNGRSKRRSKKN